MLANESTPCLTKIENETNSKQKSKIRFYHPDSIFYRFLLLLLICFIPFGGHFVKNCMSSLEQLMLEDPALNLTNTQYGALISAVSLPNMLIPFWGGIYLDKRGDIGILCFLLATVLGQAIFAFGMYRSSYALALVGRIIFGIGEGSVVVGARVIVSHWFADREITFAIGVTVALANVSKMIAKSSVAPISIYYGTYIAALWFSVGICVFSLFMGALVLFLTYRLQQFVKKQIDEGCQVRETLREFVSKSSGFCPRERNPNTKSLRNVDTRTVLSFPFLFWILVILHVVFINVFHLFQNVSSSYLYQTFGYSIVKSGYISSLSHCFVIFAPAIGLFVDCMGGRLYIVIVSALLSIVSYSLLLYTSLNPIISLVLMSICLSFTPTILMASIPLVIQPCTYGVGYGIVEVTDAVGAAVGNLGIGYIRDITGNYDADMKFLLAAACVSLILTLVLLYEDFREGYPLSKLNSSKTRSTAKHRISFVDDEDPPIFDDFNQKLESCSHSSPY